MHFRATERHAVPFRRSHQNDTYCRFFRPGVCLSIFDLNQAGDAMTTDVYLDYRDLSFHFRRKIPKISIFSSQTPTSYKTGSKSGSHALAIYGRTILLSFCPAFLKKLLTQFACSASNSVYVRYIPDFSYGKSVYLLLSAQKGRSARRTKCNFKA